MLTNATALTLKAQTPNAQSSTGVISGYGEQSLLSNTFTTGAEGIYGTINSANKDLKYLTSSYSEGTAGVSGTETGTKDDTYLINYYKSLYNAMATGGWKTDNKITDSSYLSQQMIYGNVVLNKFNNNASWRTLQLSDSTTGLNSIDDESIQEKAQEEYESQAAILETRTSFLENQIESLKTEQEAVSTEQDSLNEIIEKEQEKLKLFVSA